jgi:CRISPR-associated protein Csx16
MAIYFISRHKGAVPWLEQQGIQIQTHFEHCHDVATFKKDDVVYGNLPLHLIETLTKKGVRYYHLVLDIPAELRGLELAGREFDNCNPRFIEYKVVAVANKDGTK